MQKDPLKSVARMILKEKFPEFENLTNGPRSAVPAFLRGHTNIIESIIDVDYYAENIEELTETVIFLAVAVKNRVIETVDWSGEEYSGQVKRGISSILKQQDRIPVKWSPKNPETKVLALTRKRGEFLPLLFRELDKELEAANLSIGFFECGDDAYHYFVLPAQEFEQIFNIHDEGFIILDTNIYDLCISDTGPNAAKVMIYLKNRFNISLSEIKTFMQQDNILIGTGTMSVMNFLKNEVESLGATTHIRKKDD